MEDELLSLLHCKLCPRQCGMNRREERGFCGAGTMVRIARAGLHLWEEPCLIGECGAGTVFFSHCNLGCVFCQNYEISHEGFGIDVTEERLAEIFLELQEQGAATLDLVTPTHYLPQILSALSLARGRGCSLPVVYNTSGYERTEILEILRNQVDIFLPDLKYFSDEAAMRYANAPQYTPCAKEAIRKMQEIVGAPIFDPQGQMIRGVLVRHLVLPGRRKESMALLDWLWANFGDDIQLSLMSQYQPFYRAGEFQEIARRLTSFEYDSVVRHAQSLGFTRCYVQERSSAAKEYVPIFDGTGVRSAGKSSRI